LFNFRPGFHDPYHDRRRSRWRNNIAPLPSIEYADIESTLSQYGVVAPIRIQAIRKDTPQGLNSRDSLFGITGVRRSSLSLQVHHQGAFLGARQLVAGGLADDHELRIPLQGVCGFG